MNQTITIRCEGCEAVRDAVRELKVSIEKLTAALSKASNGKSPALPPTVANNSKKLLTAREAAERLGVKLQTVRKWMWKRRIASVKLGYKAVRITEAEIQRLLDSGYRAVRPEQR